MRGFLGYCRRAARAYEQQQRLRFLTSQASVWPLQQYEQEQRQRRDATTIFQRRMEMAGVKPEDRIALSVSGGMDSMALCLLAREWKLNHCGSPNGLIALTVDHGVRSENKVEALLVQTRLKDMGIECDVLQGGMTPGTSIKHQERRRYDLLRDACLRHNVEVLLVAHNADDLVGMFLLRLSMCAGDSGLAAIPFVNQVFSKEPPWEVKKLRIINPLLELCKRDLCEVCLLAGLRWIENRKPKGKVQKNFADLPEPTQDQIHNLILMYRKKRVELDAAKNRLLSEIVEINTDYGYVVVDSSKLSQVSREDALRTVKAIIRFMKQKAKPPRNSIIERALNWLLQPKENHYNGIDGCTFSCLLGSRVMITSYADASTPDKPPAPVSAPRFINIFKEKAKYMDLLRGAVESRVISQKTAEFLAEAAVDTTKVFVAERDTLDEETRSNKYDMNVEGVYGRGKYFYFKQRFLVKWQPGRPSECNRCMDGDHSCLLEPCLDVQIRVFRTEDLLELEKTLPPEETEIWEALERFKTLPKPVQLGIPVLVGTEDQKIVAIPSVGLSLCANTEMSIQFCPRFPLVGDHMLWI